MQREPVIDMLNDAEDKEEAKEKSKFLHRSMSMDSNEEVDEGHRMNLFRGGSFDEKFFKPATQSFEPGFGFDTQRQDSFEPAGGMGGSSFNLKHEGGSSIELVAFSPDNKVGEGEGIAATL